MPAFEYRSRLHIRGLPLVHVVRGVDPSSGRRPPAIGVIAVGQVAIGLIAIGQVAFGIIGIGQAAIGLGWGIGQLAFGLLTAGQVACGALGAIGQIAVGPAAFGMVTSTGPWVAGGWAIGGLLLIMLLANRHLRALFAAAPRAIASVTEGTAHISGQVVSQDRLRTPLSNRPCVFWQTMHVGPTVRAHERSAGEVTIADETGTARVDLGSNLIFIRGDDYREIAGPDWGLHLETAVSHGETVHIAGPVTLAPDPAAGGAFRGGGFSPLFVGLPEAPVIITTRNPGGLRAEHRFATLVGWTLLAAGLTTLPLWLVALGFYR
jgi:hypothetical protein